MAALCRPAACFAASSLAWAILVSLSLDAAQAMKYGDLVFSDLHIEQSGKVNASRIQSRCAEGWIQKSSCFCGEDRERETQCERCTIAKNCEPDALSVTSNYVRDKCICMYPTTTNTVSTTTDEFEPEWPDCIPDPPPRAVVFVFDVSGSMSTNSRMQKLIGVLPHLLHHFVRVQDEIAVITFNDVPIVRVAMQSVVPLDASLEDEIKAYLTPGGATAIYDSLDTAITESHKAPSGMDRAVILVSDGESNSDKKVTTAAAATRMLKDEVDAGGFKFLSIGLDLHGPAADTQEEFALATGGMFANAQDDIESIKDNFGAIAGELCSTTYEPDWPDCNPEPDPRAVTFVFDVSGSMLQYERMETIKGMLPHLFHHFVRLQDDIAVITFNDKVQIRVPMQADTVVDATLEADILAILNAAGGTAIYDSLAEAIIESKKATPGMDRVIILVSDGVSGDDVQETFDTIVTKLANEYNAGGFKFLSMGLSLIGGALTKQEQMEKQANGFFVNAKDDLDDVKAKFVEVANTLCSSP